MTAEDVVLITGVHGVSGRAAARHWASVPGVRVYGLSRRSAPLPQGVQEIIGDLLDRAGFHDCIDTEEMFSGFFADLRKNRIIPQLKGVSQEWHEDKGGL